MKDQSALNRERWKEISPYLDLALSLSGEERVAWLRDLQTSNPQVANELHNLLEEQKLAREEQFLEGTVSRPAMEASLAGQTVGAYTLLSPIGQGGMGSVWLASRSDGRFERQVAIKFLNFALATPVHAERFKREGSILGRLAHPHIAELIDAGITANGVPYLVLEYVEGEPIDRYCDSRKLDVQARIQLFLDVVSAVAQAHFNLVVHRDIKPSNVLVRTDGQVKLLDFGIAKLLAEQTGDSEATALTINAGGALTPQFAAPEQVTGAAISTGTDVYALGILLFVLLTGHHPAGTATGSPVELLKAIVETEADKPSAAVTAAAAETRETSLDKLRRQLHGDPDTIIGKALKKKPEERYASVTAFGDDLKRYLANQPITARPDTLAYRVGKFARRNRIGLAVAGFAFTAILAALGVAIYQARLARQRFQDVRNLAHEFVFDLHDEVAKLEGSTKAREMMVRTALEYLDDLGQDAGHDLELQKEIAAAYVKIGDAQGYPTKPNLGRSADALASYRKAGDIYRALAEKDKSYLVDLANYYVDYAGLVRFTHDLTKARGISQSAIDTFDLLRSRQGLNHDQQIKYANAWCTLGDIEEDMGLYRQARADFGRCRDVARAEVNQIRDRDGLSLLAQADERVATASGELGNFDESLSAIDEDETLLNELLAAEPQNPRLHRRLAILNEFRADVYYSDVYPNREDAAKGLAQEKRYLAAAEEMVRQDPSNSSAQFSRAVALFRVSQPLREIDPPAAIRMAEESVHAFDQIIASGKSTYLVTSRRVRAMWRLGEAQLKDKKIDEAIKTARIGIDTEAPIAAASGSDMEEQGVFVYLLILSGKAHAAAGDFKAAEDALARARQQAKPLAANGELVNTLPLVRAERALGAVYAKQHRIDDARECYTRVNDLWQQFPDNNEYVAHQKETSSTVLASLR